MTKFRRNKKQHQMQQLGEVEARDVIASLVKSGRWAVYLSTDGKTLSLKSRCETIHTLSDFDPPPPPAIGEK